MILPQYQGHVKSRELHSQVHSWERHFHTHFWELHLHSHSRELHAGFNSGELHADSDSEELHTNSNSRGLHAGFNSGELQVQLISILGSCKLNSFPFWGACYTAPHTEIPSFTNSISSIKVTSLYYKLNVDRGGTILFILIYHHKLHFETLF